VLPARLLAKGFFAVQAEKVREWKNENATAKGTVLNGTWPTEIELERTE
jgi:hypothetical protein